MFKVGYIKIFRSILDWAWYHDANTFRVFMHLILTANFEPHAFEDITVERGQRVISIKNLADELSLSEKNVRTALKHLKKTGEVAVKATSKYSIITIKNYNFYQSAANDGRAADTQKASHGRQYKKDNNNKKDRMSHKRSYDINELEEIDTLDFIE